MRTTVNLDDDVARVAREIAQADRRPLGRVLSELARRGLQPRTDRIDLEAQLPVVRVSSKAKPITPQMVEDALDEY